MGFRPVSHLLQPGLHEIESMGTMDIQEVVRRESEFSENDLVLVGEQVHSAEPETPGEGFRR